MFQMPNGTIHYNGSVDLRPLHMFTQFGTINSKGLPVMDIPVVVATFVVITA